LDLAVLGCSLDVLDAADRVAMKLAYMSAASRGIVADGLARDPYDLLAGDLSKLPGVGLAGKLELEPFLTPRPSPPDALGVDPDHYREFLDADGCSEVSARLSEFVRERVLPLRPLLVGVDHALTGGVLEALAASGVQPVLIVLDSHFDAIPADVRREAHAGAAADPAVMGSAPDSYNCGTWLAAVIGRGLVSPDGVVVLGPSDHPGERGAGEPEGMAAYRHAYLALEESGVRVAGKKALREAGIRESIGNALDGLEGRPAYISLDADIGSGDEVKAVRFLDTIGLSFDEVVLAGRELSAALAERGMDIAGLDIMEIDVHLADIPDSGDRTTEMCTAFARELLAGVTT
jgi:arginase family enzyme